MINRFPDTEIRNYTLDETEDFLYVKQGGKILAVFNARAASLGKVDKFIADREAGIVT